jgi:ABC-2 type transport system permease protein
VWRRELQLVLRAPIVYVVGGLFLVVQGVAFAALVGALSDPRRPAPLGALLEGQLAGTLLTWVLELVVLTLLGARAIVDERRTGTWELLLTARVSETAAIVGKWLAAATIYALLWLPTLAYFALVAAFRADAGGWDVSTIASGYLGAIALGAALLAWAIAASAAATSTLGAGALAFAALLGAFLVGELPALWPDLAAAHPALARALAVVSLRGELAALARGEVSATAIAFVIGLAATGLSLAIALASAGRRRRRDVRARFVATALVAAIAALAVALAARHPDASWDVSADQRNSLDAATRELLAELPAPATVTVVAPTLGTLDALYDEVARVADRMAAIAPLVVRRVDPVAIPGGLDAAARAAGVPPEYLAKRGGVVVELGVRRRVVDVFQLADIPLDGPAQIRGLAVEQAIAGALAELSESDRATACATTGHGERSLVERAPDRGDWTAIADRLRGYGFAIEETDLAGGVPAKCDVLVVAGPRAPLSPDEALAVQAFAKAHGVLVAAAAAPLPTGELADTGLSAVLAGDGLGLPPAIVVDPTRAAGNDPSATTLVIVDGYAPQAINDGFASKRATLWFRSRAVATRGGARALVSASDASWGERDFARFPPTKDSDDLAGPVALAALGARGTMIALGSAESFDSAHLAAIGSANERWLARAIRFLAKRPLRRAAEGRRATEVRLVMTDGERRAVVALSIAGIPLVWLVVGGGFVWWRRRRGAKVRS